LFDLIDVAADSDRPERSKYIFAVKASSNRKEIQKEASATREKRSCKTPISREQTVNRLSSD